MEKALSREFGDRRMIPVPNKTMVSEKHRHIIYM